MTQTDGAIIILAYLVVISLLTKTITNKNKSKLNFLVANRSLSWQLAAFSVAATWVCAPSMFVASEKAYTAGWVGVFWFVLPNVLPLAKRYINYLLQGTPKIDHRV